MRKRQWKKILSVVLALAMVFSMNTAVFADEVTDPVAVAEPAATEEPVAEAPAETEAPAAEAPAEETEEAVAEEPAASEAAAEETIEEPAAEAPAAAEVAEPVEAAAPAEEASGYDDSKWVEGKAGDHMTVSFVNASGAGLIPSIKGYISENEAGNMVVLSMNNTTDIPDGFIVLKGDGTETAVKRVYVSSNQESINPANVDTVAVSGSGVKLASDLEIWLTEDGSTKQTADKKVAPGHIIDKDGALTKSAGDYTTNYDAEAAIYPNTEVKMTISYDDVTLSFDQAVSKVVNNTKTEILKADSPAKDFDVTKAENLPGSNLFVLIGDKYASVDGTIPALGTDGDLSAAITPSQNGGKFTAGNTAGFYGLVVNKNLDKVDYATVRAWNKTGGWKAFAANEANVEFSSDEIKPGTKNTMILKKAATGSAFAIYKVVTFTTKAEVPTTAWEATNDWYAVENGVVKTVSKNGDTLSINGLAGGYPVTLAASENAASVNKVFVNATGVVSSVILSANKTGVEITNAEVFNEDGVSKGALKSKVGDVVVNSAGKAALATGVAIENGEKVYQAESLSLTESANFVVDYEKTQAALVKNTGKVVGTDVEFTAKGTKVDVDKIVESSNVIIEYTDAAAKGYKYGYVAGTFGSYYKAPADAPGLTAFNIKKTKAKYFEITDTKASDQEYAIAAAKADDFKALTYDVKANAATAVSPYKVVSLNKTTALTPGSTYYVYAKSVSDPSAAKFTRFYAEPVKVELGVEKTITLTPRHDGKKFVLSGDTVSQGDFTVTATADKDFDLDKEIDLTGLSLGYKLSANGVDSWTDVQSVASLKGGKYRLSVNGTESIDDSKIKDNYKKNEYTFKYAEGVFLVADGSSKLDVKTNGKYFFGQEVGEKTVGEENYFVVTLKGAEGAVAYEASALDIVVSQDAIAEGDKTGKPGVDATTAANGKFHAKFFGKGSDTVSSEDVEVTVTARPVYVGAKKNFFKKTGDTVSDAKIKVDDADFELVDVEDGKKATDYLKGDLALNKTSVTTAKGSDVAQVYDLDIASGNYASDAVKKNVESGNIIISAGSAEGFAYYVFPVYQATFNGHFKSAKYEGETIKKDAVKTVSSDAAKKIADYEKNEVNKKDVAYTATAVVTLPTDVEVNGDFMGWKSSLTGKIVNEKTDTISSDVIYSASVKERVPGFTSSQNSLQVEFDADNIVFTGKKHVTDPGYQLGQRYGENGVENAITALIKAANAGTPDITLNISVGNKTLLEGYDYKAVYKNNINAYDIEAHKSDANFSKKAPQVTITFKGGYAQYPSITKYFSIEPASLTATDGAAQGEPVASVYVKEGAKLASVKTGLFNGYTGAPLVANKNGKKDLVIKINGSDPTGAFVKGNEYKVTVEGKNNYKDTIDDVELTVVGKKDFKAVKAAANKAKDFVLDSYTNTDTYEAATEDERFVKTVIEQIGKNKTIKSAGVNVEEIITSGGADVIRTSAVKNVDYIVPGAKKINYAVDIPVTSGEGEAEKTVVYAVTGTIAYTVPKAKTSDIEIKWADVPEGGVPYVATGATLGYETSYKGESADLSRILTVTYSKNKNPGKEGLATVKPVKKAYIEGTFDKKTFAVGKAKLTEDNIALCYVVKSDKKDNDAKTQKAIAKRGSVVIKDELGNVLKAGKDYDLKLGQINVTASGNDNIDLAVSGKGKYDGSFNLNPDVLDEAFLGSLTLKNKATGTNKNFSLKEMTDLEEGTVSTNDIAKNHSIDVFNGKNALGTAGTDYDIVITTAGNGGFAFVTAVGIDGGKFGGSDVLAKKAIKVKVK